MEGGALTNSDVDINLPPTTKMVEINLRSSCPVCNLSLNSEEIQAHVTVCSNITKIAGSSSDSQPGNTQPQPINSDKDTVPLSKFTCANCSHGFDDSMKYEMHVRFCKELGHQEWNNTRPVNAFIQQESYYNNEEENYDDDQGDGNGEEYYRRSNSEANTCGPLSSQVVSMLPQEVITEKMLQTLSSENQSCLICLQQFQEGEMSTFLPCLHHFHYIECVKWFEFNNICPICRTDVEEHYK